MCIVYAHWMKRTSEKNVDNFPPPKREIKKLRDVVVRKLFKLGYNKVEIARHVGISRITVASILKKKR